MSDVRASSAARPGRTWLLAALAGAVAAALLYRARIGINVTIWTVVASAGLVLLQRERVSTARMLTRMLTRMLALPIAFAVTLAGGVALTADADMQRWTIITVLMLLALATRLAAVTPAADQYGAIFIATAPPLTLLETLRSGVRATSDGIGSIGVLRGRPALRGALLGGAVIVVFAALFADADPLFARGRDIVSGFIDSMDFLPRLVFFAAVSFGVLGAYAYATRAAPRIAARVPSHAVELPLASAAPVADRAIVLGSAAAVCWIFVALQIAYVATNAPALAGSGVTYAEYAHRGFAQLSVVATLALLLVVEALGRVRRVPASNALRGAAYALVGAVSGVLASAFHRVTLYENVYGFTTTRVQAQAYMLCVLAVLVLCAVGIFRGFDAARLARQTMAVALTALLAFAVWNDQAWVVRQDVARFSGSRRLDVAYLATLAPDAYPALLDALPHLPEVQRQQLASELWPRAACAMRDDRWFEWNLSRARARAAFQSRGFTLTPLPDRPCPAD